MLNWKRSKAGTGYQYVAKRNDVIYVIYKNSFGNWVLTEWNEGRKFEDGRNLGTLKEAKQWVEGLAV